jgi:UDP-glucose 4-epimerase
MSVLVTGGAGYIGAHVVRLLTARGDSVVVVDDLSSGRRERSGDVPLVDIDLSTESSPEALAAVMREYEVGAVIHIAAKKQVGESAKRPAYYYKQNVGGSANLLEAMESAEVDRLMFSSSAATYGLPDVEPGAAIGEDVRPAPISPYGETKLVSEWLNRAAGAAWGLRTVNLRYFNVAGSGWDDLGDPGVHNLIPIVLSQLTRGEQPVIFGDDYDTPDGTCIRDYVHVLDLAQAHIAALDHLDVDDRPHDVFNVGTGTGASVREVLDEIARSTGLEVKPTIAPRRPGDPDRLVARVERIRDVLGWSASAGLSEIVDSAWAAWERTPAR